MKRLLFLLFFVSTIVQAAFTDIQFGRYQIADSQWNVSACLYTTTCQIYSKNPGTAYKIPWTSGQLSWATGDYVRFLAVINSDGTQNTTNPWQGVQFNSNNQVKAIMGSGHIVNMGSGYFFFVGYDNNTGQLFSGATGMSGTSGVTWTGTLNPTVSQVDAYAANYSPTPLASGTTYTATPTYSSSITTQQQARVNDATTRLNAITKNAIYIDQVASNNIVNIQQNTRNNQVNGVSTTNAPIEGSLNNITIRQGDTGSRLGNNLIDLSVTGTGSNTLNLNQGTDTNGNWTGGDIGKHYQLVTVNGYSNTVTTQQQNTGGAIGNYLEANVIGNYNTVSISQTGGAVQKQVFSNINGNNNTVNATQAGASGHYLDVTLSGNGNSVISNQNNTGATGANAATINLTNGGGPASVNLTQTGGQVYNILSTCVTVGGCQTITVRQGN